ncbi:MAG: cell envelope integrity protein CreD [Prevotellaceae bacterium]|jgi:inner membrane protein|nr:cell envelope integrity protein CreD [Prevotellaceae bacterium]
MNPQERNNRKFTQSITFKALTVVILTLLLLIPQAMIKSLIAERQQRSEEVIRKINEKWSNPQTICGPVLSVPYLYKSVEIETIDEQKREKVRFDKRLMTVAPSTLNIHVEVFPETKYYGIYKTTLYRSELTISGSFNNLDNFENFDGTGTKYWNEAYISIGISDLKGLVSDAALTINGNVYSADAEGSTSWFSGNKLKIPLKDLKKSPDEKNVFSCKMTLNGSEEINFIPVGRTTSINVSGKWAAPGFIGNFSPQSTIENGNFSAKWHVLHFNRNIPEAWSSSTARNFNDYSFGVRLVETVDHYQQNMRSAKYALMFIALTFVVFFFVELLTKKKIHLIQYLLVGIALVLFYSLLLSISEQTGFALAYLIASFATIGLITAYTYGIFKNVKQTGILTVILGLLYTFLFVILQLEDIALLIGSIGMFIILGIIMFVSRKINWNKQEEFNQ